jgi:hypothetical protein
MFDTQLDVPKEAPKPTDSSTFDSMQLLKGFNQTKGDSSNTSKASLDNLNTASLYAGLGGDIASTPKNGTQTPDVATTPKGDTQTAEGTAANQGKTADATPASQPETKTAEVTPAPQPETKTAETKTPEVATTVTPQSDTKTPSETKPVETAAVTPKDATTTDGATAQGETKGKETQPEAKDSKTENSDAPKADRDTERQKLETWGKSHLRGDEQKNFLDDVGKLNDRADPAKGDLSDQQVADTFKAVNDMVTTGDTAAMSQSYRAGVAEQVLHNAADPDDGKSMYQGDHGSCVLASAEYVAYKKDPADAANLMRDMTVDGQHTDKNGVTVRLKDEYELPKPDAKNSEAALYEEGGRNVADGIYQHTVANLHYGANPDSDGNTLRYEHKNPPADQPDPKHPDEGDRLVSYNKEGVGTNVKDADGKDVNVPSIHAENVSKIIGNVGGDADPDKSFIAHRKNDTTADEANNTVIESEDQLKTKLQELQDKGGFPATIRVNANVEPFRSQSGGDYTSGDDGGSGGAHQVTITGYKDGQAIIKNTASTERSSPLGVDQLWAAMHDDDGARNELNHQVAKDWVNGKVDPEKANEANQLADDRKVSAEDSTSDWRRALNDVIAEHNGTEQLQLLQSAKQQGITGGEEYLQGLAQAANQVQKDHKGTADMTPEQRRENTAQYLRDSQAYYKAMGQLNAQDRRRVFDYLAELQKDN